MLNKPINSSPHNCCVDVAESKTFRVEYEIPNNEKIDGRYILVNDLDTGEQVYGNKIYQLPTPTSKVDCDVETYYVNTGYKIKNDKEYSWNSFYWQTPNDEDAISYTVTNIDGDVIHLQPKGNCTATLTPEYAATPSFSNGKIYKKLLKYTDHFLEDNAISSKNATCYQGVIDDYVGYYGIYTDTTVRNIISEVGLGCVIEIYDRDDVIATRARVVACIALGDGLYAHIVDNPNISSQMNTKIDAISNTGGFANIYKYKYMKLYNIDDLDKKSNITSNLICTNSGDYCLSTKCQFEQHDYSLRTTPNISEKVNIGDTINTWSHDSTNFNTTPTYYFRTKTSPVISINDYSQLTEGGDNLLLKDIKCKFSVNYESSYYRLNYFYLYLYSLNSETNEWILQERSPMLYTTDDMYEFSGFVNGQKYRVNAVCTDQDGDEWTTEDIEFNINIPPITNCSIPTKFNPKTTTIEIELDNLLAMYKNASIEVYKVLKSDMSDSLTLDYVGGGISKIGSFISFNKLTDYNIKNDSYYDYYIRVAYTGKESDNDEGVDLFLAATDMHTEFDGTSILGLEKSSNSKLGIVSSFNLFCRLETELGELTNEISREYINAFNQYPKELKGHQNYISGNCSGLLGSECNGVYEEPKGIRNAWNRFINDDTIKLYRGFDGETMIISIETSRVKPHYFPEVGMVNEVHITFKEIAPTNRLAIFTTEKIGD